MGLVQWQSNVIATKARVDHSRNRVSVFKRKETAKLNIEPMGLLRNLFEQSAPASQLWKAGRTGLRRVWVA